MKISTISIVLIFGSLLSNIRVCSGQSNINAKNIVYLEVAGNHLFYSLNYERYLLPALYMRAGISAIEFIREEEKGIDFYDTNIMLNYLIGTQNSRLEIGAGFLFLFITSYTPTSGPLEDTRLAPTLTIGYRYQPQKRGLMFKLGFTPFISKKGVFLWGGLGIGFVF